MINFVHLEIANCNQIINFFEDPRYCLLTYDVFQKWANPAGLFSLTLS